MPPGAANPPFLDRERAAAAGRKGAAQREKNRADPRWAVKRQLGGLFSELLRAAKGEGSWKELPPAGRLQALLKAIEYGVGKPIGLDKETPKDTASEGNGAEAPGTLKFD